MHTSCRRLEQEYDPVGPSSQQAAAGPQPREPPVTDPPAGQDTKIHKAGPSGEEDNGEAGLKAG